MSCFIRSQFKYHTLLTRQSIIANMSSKINTSGRDRIVRQLNYIRQFEDEVCSVCRVHVPGGFPFQAFTLADGRLSIVSIATMFDSVSHFMDKPIPSDPHRSHLYFHSSFAGYFGFVGTLKVVVDQNIYNMQVPKYPLTFNCFLRHIGTTSFSKTITMKGPNDFQEYASVSFSVIIVDPISRTPVHLPKSWREKYSKFQSNTDPINMERLTRPPCANGSAYRINFSKIDEQNHTTWHAYIDFCFQTCMEGVFKHWFRGINDDIAANGIKSFEISFLKESMFDNILTVFVWEDNEKDDCVLCFEIIQKTFICAQARMTFFRTPLLIKFVANEPKL